MNGLKFIRIRCNLSSSRLSNILGITRQALSSWENSKKEIPEHRLSELSEFFGIEEKYFGEIDNNDIQYIISKPMFMAYINNKETFKFKPEQNLSDYESQVKYYFENRTISLDEELSFANKRKQKVLNEIDNIIKWREESNQIDRIMFIMRNCEIYEAFNGILEYLRDMDILLKVPFLCEVKSVIKSMQIAYGLMNKSEVHSQENCNIYTDEDTDWIIELSDILKKHWNESATRHFDLVKSSIAMKKYK